MCENGFYMKFQNKVSMYDNDRIELDCFSANLSLEGTEQSVKSVIGSQHKVLKGLPSSNMSLSKTLDYLSPTRFGTIS